MDSLNLSHEEGFRQFVRSVGQRYNNPYAVGSEDHQRFQSGWRDAALLCGQPQLATMDETDFPDDAAINRKGDNKLHS